MCVASQCDETDLEVAKSGRGGMEFELELGVPSKGLFLMQCPKCKIDHAHRSHRRGLERLAGIFGYYPYRCRECGHRFLHFRYAAIPVGPREGVRRLNGRLDRLVSASAGNGRNARSCYMVVAPWFSWASSTSSRVPACFGKLSAPAQPSLS